MTENELLVRIDRNLARLVAWFIWIPLVLAAVAAFAWAAGWW